MKNIVLGFICSICLLNCSRNDNNDGNPPETPIAEEDVSEGQSNWIKYAYWEKTQETIFIDTVIEDIVINDSVALIAGNLHYSEPRWIIYRSEDYGKTWSTVKNDLSCGAGSTYLDIDFPSQSTGYVLGYCMSDWYMAKSIDGGKNWIRLSSNRDLADLNNIPSGFSSPRPMHFFSEDVGLVGNWKTTDGGSSWTEIEDLANSFPYTFSFLDDTTKQGYCTSVDKILKTENNGDTWTLLYEDTTQFLSEIHFISSTIGFVATKTELLKTVDGGISWIPIFSGEVKNISFVSQDIGFIVTDKEIFKTTDQGVNWELNYRSDLIKFKTIAFEGSNFGIAAGGLQDSSNLPNDKGYLIVTETQGN